MTVNAIIQARCGSTRFPDKVFADINGKPLIWHVVDRLKHAKTIDKIVIATTTNTKDEVIENWCEENGVACFRGCENDVLNRYYSASVAFPSDVVVRITADDPFKEPAVIDAVVNKLINEGYDHVTNNFPPSFPEGLDCEAFRFPALKESEESTQDPFEREHVTQYIYHNPDKFKIGNVASPKNLSHLRWTIDKDVDYEMVKAVYAHRNPMNKGILLLDEILDILEQNPEIAQINSSVERSAMYKKNQNIKTMKRFTDLEKKYVLDVIDNGFATSKNSIYNNKLEKQFAEMFGAKYAIGHCNGTATLHVALMAVGAQAGDEVIVPALTMSSTSIPVVLCGAIPVFADSDPDTCEISAESIEKCITPKTKAVITVSLFGLAPDYDKICAICRKHNIALIEDNAECFLGEYKGKLVGQFGDIASFSFQASKHLTTGEGGMLITNNEELADKIRRLNCLGYAGISAKQGKITRNEIQDPNYSRHISFGYNYRMSELQAAVACGQIERSEELVQNRIEVARIFAEAIKGQTLLKPQAEPVGYKNSYWTYVLVLNTDNPDVEWYRFRDIFQKNGGDGYYAAWKLSYNEPAYQNILQPQPGVWQKFNKDLCPNAEYLQKRLIQLKTNYWDLDEARQQAEILKKTIAEYLSTK